MYFQLFGDVTYVAPMIKTADILSKKNVSVYVYTFEHRSKEHPLEKWLGKVLYRYVCRGSEYMYK